VPVPKRKTSKRRRDQRSANKGLKPKAIAACQTCQSPIAAHQACKGCGYYKGIKVLTTKTDRMYTRGQAREAQASKIQARAESSVASSDSAAE
jgi:large subunit ribosomal protein L32